MAFRLYLIFFIFLPTVKISAQCIDPVESEYLVVTKHPEQILASTTGRFKTSNHNNVFIYNHKQNFLFSKAKSRSSSQKTNLDYSTLILNLSKQQLIEIERMQDTHVSQNCYVEALEVTHKSEPYYSYQWGLQHVFKDIDFETITPKEEIVVAVSDTGFDLEHEDLESSLWINTTELNGQSGVDDDGNGCIDDIHGCDVTIQNGNITVNTYKSNLVDHGTHVAGIIGANSRNRLALAGATLNSKLMLIKAFSSTKKTTSSDLLKSIYYAVDNGASIINCSWGTGSLPSVAEFNAFEYARLNNVIAVVAAGNSATYASKTSPAGLSNVIAVGSINSRNQLSTFSNFGDSVDILAPGGDGVERRNESILSLGVHSQYIQKKGTSMSAPFVSAVLANLKSIYPELDRKELINILLLSASKQAVQGYFDPKYQDELRLLDFSKALELAKSYTENELGESLSYEPKTVVKPSNAFSSSLDPSDRSPSAENNGSGCGQSNLQNRAGFISWLFFLLPLLWLQIKKRTL